MENKYKLIELTPESEKCGVAPCPAIYKVEELTPEEMKCGPIAGCPAIHEYKEKYLIIGKVENAKEFGLVKKVGEGEILISVPKELINKMNK
jgi:hypothetical protein